MKVLRLVLFLLSFSTARAFATPLVTGNGFGFAVVSLPSGTPAKFYVHPYKFEKPNHSDPYGDGILTQNLIENVTWQGDSAVNTLQYLEQSHIVAAQGARAKYFYFMPFGLKRSALIMMRRSPGPTSKPITNWSHPVRAVKSITFSGLTAEWTTFTDIKESALLVRLNEDDWALLSVENRRDLVQAKADIERWQNNLSGDELVRRERLALERWRIKPGIHFANAQERNLWRQSEVILRMAQSRESNHPGRYNHGLIVASLPEGGWFMPWVRDMSYAALALLRMGHKTEARWALEAYFNARPIGRVKNMVRGFPYQVSVVRYFGDGSEETDFGGEFAPNVELDNWGLVLTLLSEYVEKYHAADFLTANSVRGSVYLSARDFIVKPLIGNLDVFANGKIVAADTSIWEANSGSEQHFSYSSALAINGLRGFSKLAQMQGDFATKKRIDQEIALLEPGFDKAFIRNGIVHGTLEDNPVYNIDSAVLEAVNFSVVTDPNVIHNTLLAMEQLKMPSGGYRRIRGDRQYDKQEFVFCDFNWARNYLRLGQPEMAKPLIDQVVNRAAADHGFIPEMFVSEINNEYPGEIGAPTGSTPMVGYGAGMVVLYLLERENPDFH